MVKFIPWKMGKYKGETHALLLTTRGFKRANYCGPGTNLETRLKDGDKPVSNLDAICQQHDMAYDRATTAQEIRFADHKMIQEMDKDPWIPIHEKVIIGNMMRAKILGEKISGKTFFAEVKEPEYENQHPKACRKRENLRACLVSRAKAKSKQRRRATKKKTRFRSTKKAKTKRTHSRLSRN